MKQKIRPKFYALYKDFNDGEIKQVDVLGFIFDDIFDDRNKVLKNSIIYAHTNYKKNKYVTKDEIVEYVESALRYYFWAKCEWEAIVCDWPYRKDGLIDSARPHKIDVYDQLEPNLPIITDLVWNYIDPIINK